MPAVAATQIFLLPAALLGPNLDGSTKRHGPFITPAVGGIYSAWQMTVTPGLGYPTTPGTVFLLTVERSEDGGLTWFDDLSIDYDCGPWLDKDKNPLLADTITRPLGVLFPLDNPIVLATSPGWMYRFWLDVSRACSPQFAFAGVP